MKITLAQSAFFASLTGVGVSVGAACIIALASSPAPKELAAIPAVRLPALQPTQPFTNWSNRVQKPQNDQELAYESGKLAHQHGFNLSHNPHSDDAELSAAWMDGWEFEEMQLNIVMERPCDDV